MYTFHIVPRGTIFDPITHIPLKIAFFVYITQKCIKCTMPSSLSLFHVEHFTKKSPKPLTNLLLYEFSIQKTKMYENILYF